MINKKKQSEEQKLQEARKRQVGYQGPAVRQRMPAALKHLPLEFPKLRFDYNLEYRYQGVVNTATDKHMAMFCYLFSCIRQASNGWAW